MGWDGWMDGVANDGFTERCFTSSYRSVDNVRREIEREGFVYPVERQVLYVDTVDIVDTCMCCPPHGSKISVDHGCFRA